MELPKVILIDGLQPYDDPCDYIDTTAWMDWINDYKP